MEKEYGLIGYPLTHSFSQKYFNEKFQREGIRNTNYSLYPIPAVEGLKQLLQANPRLLGLNVTIPYKENVIPLLDELDPVAKAVGAVNCIRITDGRLKGYNTDVFGFRQSIKPFLEMHHEKALILGTGGASKAVHFVLSEIGIECFFATREKKENQHKRTLLYSELNEYAMRAFPLIVNCTPVGMFPDVNNKPELPYEFIGEKHLLCDLIYNPAETLFLSEGRKRGAKTLNGLSMLQQQAEEAWRIWNL